MPRLLAGTSPKHLLFDPKGPRTLPPQQGRVGWLCPTKSKESTLLGDWEPRLWERAPGARCRGLGAGGWAPGVVRAPEPGQAPPVSGLPGVAEGWARLLPPGPANATSLRLVGGESRCDGRVEIFQGGTWGRVLDDQWDLAEARVVCRQLRCGGAETAYNPPKPQRGTGPVGLRGVRCAGHEAGLTLCNASVPENALAAGIAEDVGVTCEGEWCCASRLQALPGPFQALGRWAPAPESSRGFFPLQGAGRSGW